MRKIFILTILITASTFLYAQGTITKSDPFNENILKFFPDWFRKIADIFIIDPIEKDRARDDAKRFRERFKEFGGSKGFYITDQQFAQLIVSLKLSRQCDDRNCAELRVYPALENGKLYLIFLGGSRKVKNQGDTAIYSNNNLPWFKLNEWTNRFEEITTSPDSLREIQHIKAFQTATFNNFNLRSLGFTLNELDTVQRVWMSNSDPRLIRHSNRQYGAIFTPCFDPNRKEYNKLYLSMKELEVKSFLGIPDRSAREENVWYNHIDPCPDKCPENEL